MEIKKDLLRKKMKNIEFSKVVSLKDEVTHREGEVVSKTLAQNNYVSITLFAFGDGEEISSHKSDGDAFVTCLDGEGKVIIDGIEYFLKEGESVVMPAGHPHSVHGISKFKMLLVVVF